MTRWSRPVCRSAVKLCRVARRDHSAHTLCGGRWSASSAEESVEEPAQEERCGLCVAMGERGEHVSAEVRMAREMAVVELERFEMELEEEAGDGAQ